MWRNRAVIWLQGLATSLYFHAKMVVKTLSIVLGFVPNW